MFVYNYVCRFLNHFGILEESQLFVLLMTIINIPICIIITVILRKIPVIRKVVPWEWIVSSLEKNNFQDILAKAFRECYNNQGNIRKLRQHRTKIALRLCAKSAWAFSGIVQKTPLKYVSIPAVVLCTLVRKFYCASSAQSLCGIALTAYRKICRKSGKEENSKW